MAPESALDPGHAAIAGAFYIVLLAGSYLACRIGRRWVVRPPLPAYFGESRVALLLMAGVFLLSQHPSLHVPALFSVCGCLLFGALVDGFWLSEVAGRRGVGFRRALALSAPPARIEDRRQAGSADG